MTTTVTKPSAIIELPALNNVDNWVRNPDWNNITTPAANEEKAVILKAVFDGTQEWTALSAAGDYTVDWGDGNVENFASGVTAEHTYNYADADLTDTSATLGYKQAVITITPQAGQSLTSLNLHLRHSLAGTSVYESGFLDVRIAGQNLISLLFGVQTTSAATKVIGNRLLECFELLNNSITNFNYCLYQCNLLQSLPAFYMSNATTANNMLNGCRNLTKYPAFDTALCTDLSFFYANNSKAKNFPFLVTSNCLSFASMHISCLLAKSLPFYDMSNAVNANSFASSCRNITSIPNYDLSNCLDVASFLLNATSLSTPPLFDISSATTCASFFNGTTNLKDIPALNLSTCTNGSSFIVNIYRVTSLPMFDTSEMTDCTSAFSGLSSIIELPSYDFSSCQTFTNMMLNNSSMRKTGIINAAAGTVFTSMYSGCNNLEYSILQGCRYTVSLASCKFSKTNLEAFIAALGVAAAGTQTLTISGNPGTGTITSLSGTTTAASKTVTFASTTGINVGDRMTGTGSPLTTPIACTFTDAGDLVTVNNHGLSNGDLVSFVTIVTTTGVVIRTPYYVTNAATNTFTVSASAGGATLPLTTNGSGTLIYDAVVESIVPNVSVTLSRPATSTSTSSKSFRALNIAPAVLRGFTISG